MLCRRFPRAGTISSFQHGRGIAHITLYSNGRKSTFAVAKIQSIDHGVTKFDWTFSDADGRVVVQTITAACPFFIEDHHEPAASS